MLKINNQAGEIIDLYRITKIFYLFEHYPPALSKET